MRIAILSDVHGNCVGLDAALADLQEHPADQIVCLGDMIQGGPQPAEVMARAAFFSSTRASCLCISTPPPRFSSRTTA